MDSDLARFEGELKEKALESQQDRKETFGVSQCLSVWYIMLCGLELSVICSGSDIKCMQTLHRVTTGPGKSWNLGRPFQAWIVMANGKGHGTVIEKSRIMS